MNLNTFLFLLLGIFLISALIIHFITRRTSLAIFFALMLTVGVNLVISINEGFFGPPLRVEAIYGRALPSTSPWYKVLVLGGLLGAAVLTGFISALVSLKRRLISRKKTIAYPVERMTHPIYVQSSQLDRTYNNRIIGYIAQHWKKVAVLVGIEVVALATFHSLVQGGRSCMKYFRKKRYNA